MKEWIKESWLTIIMGLLVACALVFAAIVFNVYQNNFDSLLPVQNGRGDWGAFGDFFGGALNPVFAFIGLIMLLVQRHP